MKSFAAWLMVLAWAPCEAAVNKCVDARGKVTYQNEPCTLPAPPTPAPSATTPASVTSDRIEATRADYASAQGAWRGPLQFHFVTNGVRAADAHAITPLVIELQADGRVRGASSDAGCRFSGLHTPFVTPANASIDVTVSGCADRRFNTRYSGHLLVNSAAKQAKLNLSALSVLLGRGASQATIDAVLRR